MVSTGGRSGRGRDNIETCLPKLTGNVVYVVFAANRGCLFCES